MKMWTSLSMTAAALLFTGMVVGCGGGGGGGGGDTAGDAELSSENVGAFVNMLSDEAGCTYNGVQSASARTLPILDNAEAAKFVVMEAYLAKTPATASRATEVIYGDCGGSATTTGDETTATMSFSNYCSGDYGGVTTTLNGSIRLSQSQTQTSATLIASTPTPLNVKAENPNTDENVDVTVALDNGRLTLNESGATTVTATSLKIDDNINDDTYTIKNLDAVMSGDGSAVVSATYIDPELGTVDVTGTTDANGNGSLTVTGANNTSSTITSTGTEGVYSVTTNGSYTGTMDCSSVDTSIFDTFLL